MVKQLQSGLIPAFIGLFSAAILLFPFATTNAAPQHGFLLKEYENFHDVLHPLEHEAIPQKDFRRIRSKANELVRLGKAVVEAGVPGNSHVQDELANELKRFDKALSKFNVDATRGSDAQLLRSYNAVHNSFEKLARLLPRVSPGSPPRVSVDCPASQLEEGDQVSLSANYNTDVLRNITWTLSVGKIITGQHTRTIAVDTSGLAGKAIKATAELDDGFGHSVAATCEMQVSVRQTKADPLQPLLFLEGAWHGEGKGPYGPYEFETIVERRGRWLLLTSNVFPPGSDKLLFFSTQVYGYDDKGLVLQLFDTAGSFTFRGESKDNALHFQWKQGEPWKRIEMKAHEGKILSRYDAYEPSMFKDPVTFQGDWLPGKRRSPKR